MTRIMSSSDINNIVNLYQSGVVSKEIAEKYRITQRKVADILRREGVPLSPVQTSIDIPHIISLYNSGVSENAIAKEIGVSRSVVRNRLIKSGVVIRSQTEANQLMMSKRTSEENSRNVKSAHDAVRGKPKTHEELCKRSITRQNSFDVFESVYEEDIANALTEKGVEFIPQLAIDKYNIDFGIENDIALEIYGGGWHANGRAAVRFDERSEELFRRGYTIVVCWIGTSFNRRFIPSSIADYLVALSEKLSSDPSARCKHYVIGSDGKPSPVGQNRLNYIS